MVGDVKQSIYKFRQARPELFLEKYEKYIPIEYRSENVNINTKKIREFRGGNIIEEIEFEDETREEINGIFIAQGVATSTDFAKKLGAMIENNYIVVNEKMETTIPNIYACGDCTGGLLQI